MAARKSSILTLYKVMLREGQSFASYNFRMYAIRKIRDSFREKKNLLSTGEIEAAVKEAEASLQIIKRQALISRLYQTDKLVIEKSKLR